MNIDNPFIYHIPQTDMRYTKQKPSKYQLNKSNPEYKSSYDLLVVLVNAKHLKENNTLNPVLQ